MIDAWRVKGPIGSAGQFRCGTADVRDLAGRNWWRELLSSRVFWSVAEHVSSLAADSATMSVSVMAVRNCQLRTSRTECPAWPQ